MFEFLVSLANWFSTGIYDFFVEWMAYFISSMVLLWFKLQLTGLDFAWGLAQTVIQNLGISSAIASAWNSLPVDIVSTARFFKVPEAFNILISAGVTRLVMSFIPGL